MVPGQAQDLVLETLPTARPVETDRDNKAVSVLLAHIISTRSKSPVVTDDDMDYPWSWKTTTTTTTTTTNEGSVGAGGGGDDTATTRVLGHQEDGRTVAIHSLGVIPKLQGCGLGKLIMKSYLQQMNNSGTVDRVALICQDVSLSCNPPPPRRETRRKGRVKASTWANM